MTDTLSVLCPLVDGLDVLINDCDYRIRTSTHNANTLEVENIKSLLVNAKSCIVTGDVMSASALIARINRADKNTFWTDELNDLEDVLVTLKSRLTNRHDSSFLGNTDWWLSVQRLVTYGEAKEKADEGKDGIFISPLSFWHILFVVSGVGLLVNALWVLPSSLYVFAVLFFLLGTFLGIVSTVLFGPFAGSGLVFVFFVPSYFFRWFTDKIPDVGQSNPLDIILPYWGGLVLGWLFIGWAIFNWRVQHECLRYGAFSTLWARIVPGDEGKRFPRYEFIRADENGTVIKQSRTRSFWGVHRILDDAPTGAFERYVKRQKNCSSTWVHCYPALFYARAVKRDGIPYSIGTTFGSYYVGWIKRFAMRWHIPVRFTDDALLNTPGLTEEKIREFFAKPYPDLSAPPGYEEFVASQGNSGSE